MPGRTIIVSDLHGYAELLDNALEQAGFGADDRLVVAGDSIDTGPDDCIAAAERHGALILAGNHEASAALDVDIFPQATDSPAKGPGFLEHFLSGAWPLAAAVDGWLVTHGGVSTMFRDEIADAGGDVERLASELNEAFRAELRRFVDGGLSVWSLGRSRIIGSELGPLWFRAGRPDLVPSGLRQVVGHTACEFFDAPSLAELTARDFLLVDPGARLDEDHRGRFRYAIVENGEARVIGGCLD